MGDLQMRQSHIERAYESLQLKELESEDLDRLREQATSFNINTSLLLATSLKMETFNELLTNKLAELDGTAAAAASDDEHEEFVKTPSLGDLNAAFSSSDKAIQFADSDLADQELIDGKLFPVVPSSVGSDSAAGGVSTSLGLEVDYPWGVS